MTLLSNQVLDVQIMKRPVSENHVRCLLEAALLLEEYGYPLPPMLGQIMHEINATAGQTVPSDVNAQDDVEQIKAKGIAWLLRPLGASMNLPY